MAQLSKDSFAFAGGLMSVDDAVELLRARIGVVAGVERVGLLDADSRVLAAPLIAPLDLPVFDNSAVDGYAARFDELAISGETRLPAVGRVVAGDGTAHVLAPGTAMRVFTGAAMPQGADMVFMQEDVRLEGADVVLPHGLKRHANMRPRGEDIATGSVALAAGRRLVPQDIGLAAALGFTQLVVRKPLRLAVFSTGDEIVSPGAALGNAQLYDSNRFILQSLLRRLGCVVTDLGILRDERDVVTAALAQAVGGHDLILTSGGVSTGDEDHVKAALGAAGSLVFWRLAIKPGRPVAMGMIDGVPVIGLPGNPVAVFITFASIVRPLIAAMSGELAVVPKPMLVTSGFSYKKKEGRREYVRVRLEQGADGLVAQKFEVEGAGVITSLTQTEGLVELCEDVTRVQPGDRVGFIDYALLR